MNPFTVLAWGFVAFTALTQIGLLLLWLDQRRDVRREKMLSNALPRMPTSTTERQSSADTGKLRKSI